MASEVHSILVDAKGCMAEDMIFPFPSPCSLRSLRPLVQILSLYA